MLFKTVEKMKRLERAPIKRANINKMNSFLRNFIRLDIITNVMRLQSTYFHGNFFHFCSFLSLFLAFRMWNCHLVDDRLIAFGVERKLAANFSLNKINSYLCLVAYLVLGRLHFPPFIICVYFNLFMTFSVTSFVLIPISFFLLSFTFVNIGHIMIVKAATMLAPYPIYRVSPHGSVQFP